MVRENSGGKKIKKVGSGESDKTLNLNVLGKREQWQFETHIVSEVRVELRAWRRQKREHVSALGEWAWGTWGPAGSGVMR